MPRVLLDGNLDHLVTPTHSDARGPVVRGQSIEVIEKASTEHGRIEWIDYRVPLNDAVDTMHLHIEAAGQYNTGTFAYRLVRRTLGHGVRMVGTLKDGPDFNVLALYEK